MNEMLEQLAEIITNYIDIDPSEIKPDASLRGDIGMSSLDMINMAVEIEDTFGISLPNNDIINISTVEELMKYIEDNK
ncbi:MAG: acyl carrier protein [Clostridia bacterium]|nr:acyl carrier protein [Clostridia bacterium]